MRANLEATGGQLVSERLSAVLTPRLGRTAARELLTRASLLATRTGLPLSDTLAGLPELAGILTKEEAAALLTPSAYTGAAPALVDRALAATPPTAAGPGPDPGAGHGPDTGPVPDPGPGPGHGGRRSRPVPGPWRRS